MVLILFFFFPLLYVPAEVQRMDYFEPSPSIYKVLLATALPLS